MTYAILGLIVAGVMFGGRWLRRVSPRRFGGLPDGAVDVLGTRPLTPQHMLHVVQVGDRVLLLGSSPDGVRTLTEITDAAEAAHLAHLCRAGGTLPSMNDVTRHSPSARASEPPPTTDSRGWESTGNASRLNSLLRAGVVLFAILSLGESVHAQQLHRIFAPPSSVAPGDVSQPAARPNVGSVVSPTTSAAFPPGTTNAPLAGLIQGADLGSTLKLGALVGVMSLAPAILLMTTCYVRIIVVLGLLRQALGTAQFPPTQVLTSLSLFLTALVMWPVWERSYREGIEPYSTATYVSTAQQDAALPVALERTLQPVRQFMSNQIEATGNAAAIDLFLDYQGAADGSAASRAAYYEDVPTRVLLPAYLLSELKTAFLLGFQIYLPFVVIDLVVSSVLTSLGLVTLPPTLVSLPFKLLLFVLIDGWYLTVELLLKSIAVT